MRIDTPTVTITICEKEKKNRISHSVGLFLGLFLFVWLSELHGVTRKCPELLHLIYCAYTFSIVLYFWCESTIL